MPQAQPRIVAIVQARMRSTRLPGKVLKPIVGQPLLWHVLHRLKSSRTIRHIIVATSTAPDDDAIAAYCAEQGVAAMRGSEDNVLERFLQAARMTQADVIVRVNADAPLVDARFVDFCVEAMVAEGADFVALKPGAFCGHDGVDPLSRRALEKLAAEAGNDPIAREHVSAYFKAHPDFVKTCLIDPPAEYAFKGARLSVDTPSDVEFIEQVYGRLNAQAGEASLTDLLSLLRREPALTTVNAHVRQKSASACEGTVIIRCDGGGAMGFGHVMRSLALGRVLRDREGLGVRMAMGFDGAATALIERQGFPVDLWPEGASEAEWLKDLLKASTAKAVVFDTRAPNGNEAVLAARRAGALTLTIDDASIRHVAADIAMFPPVPQVQRLNWRSSAAERLIGWEWVILSNPPLPVALRRSGEPVRVLITMGGSDPKNWTLHAARAAAAVLGVHAITVVIGPGFSDTECLKRALRQLPGPLEIVEGEGDLRPHMARADIAVTAFGVTAYELAAHGVPSLYLALTSDHAHSARAFDTAGMGRLLPGLTPDFHGLSLTLSNLLADEPLRRSMAMQGRQAIDGEGASRLAALIRERIASPRQALRRAG